MRCCLVIAIIRVCCVFRGMAESTIAQILFVLFILFVVSLLQGDAVSIEFYRDLS